MERLLFTSTRLRVQGKQGILRPDSEGYIEMPIGAFNCLNSVNELYTKENIEKIFHKSSDFMRKIENGKMYGEWGHPEQHPGESDQAYMARACRINDKHACAFFEKIWLDKPTSEMARYGVPMDAMVVMGRLKPMGLKWETLERALSDPNVNTTFSGRFLTRDRIYRGQTQVIVEEIITYDAVTEQGIPAAEQWLAPRLESISKIITPRMVQEMKIQAEASTMRMESANQLRSIVATAERFFASQAPTGAGYTRW